LCSLSFFDIADSDYPFGIFKHFLDRFDPTKTMARLYFQELLQIK